MSSRPENPSLPLEAVLADRLSECLATTEEWPHDSLALARQSAERAVINVALRSHSNNMTRVAQSLGISRKTLYAKCRQLGVSFPGRNGNVGGNGHGNALNAAAGAGAGEPGGPSRASQGNGQSPPEPAESEASPRRRRALISVFDKSGLVELGQGLERLNIEILATGGTAKALEEAGVTHTSVESVTGVGEMMDGRVKTLHPNIFAPILARWPQDAEELAKSGQDPIDIVIVNLYPFAKVAAKRGATTQEIIENIDIGGISLLRAAAKSHDRVAVVCNSRQYPQLLEQLESASGPDREVLKRWAGEAFAHTSLYDQQIFSWLAHLPQEVGGDAEASGSRLLIDLSESRELRYGENPHQEARLFHDTGSGEGWRQLQGKLPSYNNLVDIDCAAGLAERLKEPACVIVKHDTPCAVALGGSPLDCFERALATDRESPFGGIIAFNRPVDAPVAKTITEKVFTEVIIAPDFDAKSIEIFSSKPKLRLFSSSVSAAGSQVAKPGIKRIRGGYLVQQEMSSDVSFSQAGKVSLEGADKDLDLAWKVVASVHSNAIVAVCDQRTVGICGGQTSRIRAVRIALDWADKFLSGKRRGDHPLILASDAFFPFADNVERAAKSGVSAIVQPGGSIRDQEVIDAADAHGIAMFFTGKRVFRH